MLQIGKLTSIIKDSQNNKNDLDRRPGDTYNRDTEDKQNARKWKTKKSGYYFLENPKSRRVTEKMEESKEIKEAVEKLDSLSEDERMQRIADLREKAILDEKAISAKGLDDGIKEGIKEGEEKLKKEKLEIAKKLKNKEISINEIAEITGLSKETIEKL